MAEPYSKMRVYHRPSSALPDSSKPHSKKHYKKDYKFLMLHEHAPVTKIDFSPTSPYKYAVCSSTTIKLFSPRLNKVMKSFNWFKEPARSLAFRNDGELLAAGGQDADVCVFWANQKMPLRKFRAHMGPVYTTKWSPDNMRVLTGSDDTTSAAWDLATGERVVHIQGHEDYVRCGTVLPRNPSMWVTGSYDGTVKFWDTRTPCDKEVVCCNHASPVEDILSLSDSTIVSAGKTEIRVWDILRGGELLHHMSPHAKTITALALGGNRTHVVSASLDCTVKLFDTASWEEIQAIQYSAPVLSMAVSPSDSHLVAGTTDKMICVRYRHEELDTIPHAQSRLIPHSDVVPSTTVHEPARLLPNVSYKEGRAQRLTAHEKLLKRFQYRQALTSAVQTKEKKVVFSVLKALMHRNALHIALSGRDETTLQPLLKCMIQLIQMPDYADFIIPVCDTILDLYAPVIMHSEGVTMLLKELRDSLNVVITRQMALMRLLGGVDVILGSHSSPQVSGDVEL